MQLKSGTFEEMISSLNQANKDIIIFGAGVIGTVTLPHILDEHGSISKIKAYIDNDSNNQNNNIDILDKKIPVYKPEHIKNYSSDEYVLVLAISRFTEVLEQLEGYEWTKNWECYLAPMMCLIILHQEGGKGVHKDFDKAVIPKKLNYMWLGGKPIPDNLKKCMESWERYCPDYEIVRWDESNYDIDKHPYMKQAYEHKMYGFIPDYARVDILFNYGGIYLDTDVELKRPLDELLYQEAFCGVEKWQTLNLGGLSGCIKGQQTMKLLLDEREKISFINVDGSLNKKTCGFYDTEVIIKNGYKLNGKVQNILGMNVYTSDYFHPYDYMSGKVELTSDTFSIHHFNGGWLDDNMKKQNKLANKIYDDIFNMIKN